MADTPPADPAVPGPAPPSAKRSEGAETLRFLLKLALVVLVFRSFLLSPFSIPSESMLPRLYIGDYLFISKWNYGYGRWSLPGGVLPIPGRLFARTPDRGDVVVFRGPAPNDHEVIKRVIGLPGDTVQVTGGTLVLNGRTVPKQPVADFTIPLSPNFGPRQCDAAFQDSDAAGRPICRIPRFRETLPGGVTYHVLDQASLPDRDDTGVYTVPAGHVFLMGDNRDDSADSRFAPPVGMGFVPMDRLEGKALVTFFATDGSADWAKPWTWFTAARGERIGEGF